MTGEEVAAAMSPREVRARVGRLVAEDLLGCNLDSEADLFAAGMDSMAIMQLMLMLEEEFGVAIPVESVTREHFRTLEAVAALVMTRLGLPGETGETPARAPVEAGRRAEKEAPAAQEPFAPRELKNCDFFVRSFDAMMRQRGEGGHVAHSVLELESTPDPQALLAALEHLVDRYEMLSAVLRQPSRFVMPRWEAGACRRVPVVHWRQERGVEALSGWPGAAVCERAEDEAARWINTPLAFDQTGGGERVRLVLVAKRGGGALLMMSWSHLLVDGKGAELLLMALDRLHRTGQCALRELEEQPAPETRHLGQLWKSASPMTWRFEELRKVKFEALAPRRASSGALAYEVRVLTEAETAAVKRRMRGFSELVNLPFQLACAMRAHDAVFAHRGQRPDSLMCSVPVQTRKKGGAGPLFQNHLVMFFAQCARRELETLEQAAASLAEQHQRFLREGLDRAFDDLMRLMRWVPSGLYVKLVNWRMKGLLNSFFHSDTGEFAPGMESFLGARVRTAYHVPGFSSPPGTGLFVNEKHGRLVLTQCWREGVLKPEERSLMWECWLKDLGVNEAGE